MPLRNELESFFGALRFFTRLPVPAWVGHSNEALVRSTRYFPVVGLVIGSIAAAVFILVSIFWPKTLAVLASMAISLSLTGAFHEDGWSDMVDGFGGGTDKSQILAIMKDSQIGSFGTLALVVILLSKFFLLVEIDLLLIPLALVAGHAFSRLCATLVLRSLDYVREEGKSKHLTTALSDRGLAFATVTALLPLGLLSAQQALWAVVFALLVTLWLARLFKQRLGGYTGDCLGATQQLSEVAFYGGLLCNFF